MTHTIFNTAVTFLVSGLLGYSVAVIKNYQRKLLEKKERENLQNTALRSLLKNNLLQTFFTYEDIKEIPDCEYENFLEMLKIYEQLNGNGFIKTIALKMKQWKIKKTGMMD